MNTRRDLIKKLDEKYQEVYKLRAEIVAMSKAQGEEEVDNYVFHDKDGRAVTLSDLFGRHDELIVIHNMGKSCPYCTLWADGLSSSTPHILDRCGLALTTPNDVETMRSFAENRHWQFPYYSAAENTFTYDMGFCEVREDGKKSYWPGFTTFLKKEGRMYRIACDTFGPGDFFSPIWPMMGMLHHSDKEWHPKFSYS